jgi:hypothetical protein
MAPALTSALGLAAEWNAATWDARLSPCFRLPGDSPRHPQAWIGVLRDVSDRRGGRCSHSGSRSGRIRTGRPGGVLLEVVASAPAVPLAGEAIGGLAEERRLRPQLCDACPGGGELLHGNGDVPLGVGQLFGRVDGVAGGVEAGTPFLELLAGVGQVCVGEFVGRLGGVGFGGQ